MFITQPRTKNLKYVDDLLVKDRDFTISGLPDGFPVWGFQHWSSPDLLPLTRYLPSGDHAIQRTQFLCPEQKKVFCYANNKKAKN